VTADAQDLEGSAALFTWPKIKVFPILKWTVEQGSSQSGVVSPQRCCAGWSACLRDVHRAEQKIWQRGKYISALNEFLTVTGASAIRPKRDLGYSCFGELDCHGGPGLEGRLGDAGTTPWKVRVISPASRRYQSLGSFSPSASSVSQ
jgi:hypothetical protein